MRVYVICIYRPPTPKQIIQINKMGNKRARKYKNKKQKWRTLFSKYIKTLYKEIVYVNIEIINTNLVS